MYRVNTNLKIRLACLTIYACFIALLFQVVGQSAQSRGSNSSAKATIVAAKSPKKGHKLQASAGGDVVLLENLPYSAVNDLGDIPDYSTNFSGLIGAIFCIVVICSILGWGVAKIRGVNYNATPAVLTIFLTGFGWIITTRSVQPTTKMPKSLVLVPTQSSRFGFRVSLPKPILRQANGEDKLIVGYNNGDLSRSAEFSVTAHEAIVYVNLGPKELPGNSAFTEGYNIGVSMRQSVKKVRLGKNYTPQRYLADLEFSEITRFVDVSKEHRLNKNGCPGNEYIGMIKGDKYRAFRNQTFIVRGGKFCVKLTAIGSPEWVESTYVKQMFNSFQPQR